MSKLEPARTYSNPTATEVLRRLLDERGVEWEDCGNGATYVEHNGEAWRFDYDEPFDQLCIVCLSGYTPEQAIAATLGATPRGQCTIDRIDVNGDYEPSNCRWVDAATQNANRRPFEHQNQWTKAKENADAVH